MSDRAASSSGRGDWSAALSLDRFAKAKISKYDKRQVLQKQREVAAGKVNKLKRLKKRLEAQGKLHPSWTQADAGALEASLPAETAAPSPTVREPPRRKRRREVLSTTQHVGGGTPHERPPAHAPEATADDPTPRRAKPHKRPRPPSQLQRVASGREAAQATAQQERAERQRALAKEQQAKASKQKERQQLKHRFFQRTKRGQPVMKHRIDKILQELQHTS